MTSENKKRASRERADAPKTKFDAPSIIRRTRTKATLKEAHDKQSRIDAARAERRAAASPDLVASLAIGDRIDRERAMRRRRPMPNVRTGELRRLFAERYGRGEPMTWTFPNDDAGRDDVLLYCAVRLSAGVSPAAASREVIQFAPWLTEAEATALASLAAAEREQKRLTSKAIGERLNLRDETRTRLSITTIAPADISPEEREARRKARDAASARARRAMKRAAAIADRPPKKEPWTELGISRRTYFRRKDEVALKPVVRIYKDICERREKVPRKRRRHSETDQRHESEATVH